MGAYQKMQRAGRASLTTLEGPRTVLICIENLLQDLRDSFTPITDTIFLIIFPALKVDAAIALSHIVAMTALYAAFGL